MVYVYLPIYFQVEFLFLDKKKLKQMFHTIQYNVIILNQTLVLF